MTPTPLAVFRWLIGITKHVLGLLATSTLTRILKHLLDIGILAGAVYAVVAGVNLALVAVLLIAGSLLKAVCRYLEQYLGHLVALKALEILRIATFSALWPQAPAVIAHTRSGDILSGITKDVDRVEVFFAHTLAPAVTAVVTPLVVATTIGIVASPLQGLTVFLGAALLVLVIPLMGRHSVSQARQRMGQWRGELAHSVTDSVRGSREITGYNLENQRVQEATALGASIGAAAEVQARWLCVRSAVAAVIRLATVGSVIAVGVDSAHQVALLAACAIATWRMFDVIGSVEKFLSTASTSYAAAVHLFQIAHTPPAVSDSLSPVQLPSGPLEIDVDNVTYTYPGQSSPAVSDVNLHVTAGSWHYLVGESGSGKSTVASLIARFVDPDKGSVQIGGVDVSRVGLSQLRDAVTYVSQRPTLFAGTIADNLRLGNPAATDDQVIHACQMAEIHAMIQALPHGYDTEIGEFSQGVSGGELARLVLARALISGARVLILDEYSAHLDADTAARVAANLAGFATVLEITHRTVTAPPTQITTLTAQTEPDTTARMARQS